MKVVVSILLLIFAIFSAVAENRTLRNGSSNPVFGYLLKVGVPQATRIKKLEHAAITSGQRIVGGSLTQISQVPYQAGLIMQIMVIYQASCGGSLISVNRVLTAAHCYHDGQITAENFTVVLGSNFLFYGGTRIFTTDVAIHPNWNTDTLQNDIAVLRINPVAFSNNIQPIALPSGSYVSNTFAGYIGLASGFGMTSDNANIGVNQMLSSVEVPIISQAQCTAFFGNWATATNICTSGEGAKGTCDGDSGGPVAVTIGGQKILVGVTSYKSWYGCQAGHPAAHTRVTSYVSWIQSLL